MARYDQIQKALPVFRALRSVGLLGDWNEAQSRCAVALDVFTDRLELAFENQPSLEETRAELLRDHRGGENYRRSKFDGVIYKTALRFARKLYSVKALREKAFASLADDSIAGSKEHWRSWLTFVAEETISNLSMTYLQVSRDPNLPEPRVASDSYRYWLKNGEGWEDDRFEPEEVIPWTVRSIRAYLLYVRENTELHEKLRINWPYLIGFPDLELYEGPEQPEYDYMENTAWLDANAAPSTPIEKITPARGMELLLDDFEQDVALLATLFGLDEAL